MPKFRKKPVVIEAEQWNGQISRAMAQWVIAYTEAFAKAHPEFTGGIVRVDGDDLVIISLERYMRANPGDWIIKGIKGELYPCKPDIFEQTYEAVE